MGGSRAKRPKVAHCEGSVSPICLFRFSFRHARTIAHTYTHTAFWGRGGGGGKHSSVGPIGGAAVAGLAALGFLLHAAGLIALSRTTLPRTNKSISSITFRCIERVIY